MMVFKKVKMRISEQIWPRMVVLITSVDKKGKENIMTADFVMPLSFEPKYVAVAIGQTRMTLKNLQETEEFSLNVCDKTMKKTARICGSFSGNKQDKFKLANLTKQSSKFIKAPLIKEAPISFECNQEFLKKFGDHYIVIGKVVNEVIRKENFKPLVHKTKDVFPQVK